MSVWLLLQTDSGDRSWPERWFPDRDQAERWVVENPPSRYDCLALYELLDDGTLGEPDWFTHIAEPYRGGLAKAKVNMVPQGVPLMHRCPIDCLKPDPTAPLTEDNRWRVIATGYEDDGSGEYFRCKCGPWQEIEGDPTVIAEMVAEYPLR